MPLQPRSFRQNPTRKALEDGDGVSFDTSGFIWKASGHTGHSCPVLPWNIRSAPLAGFEMWFRMVPDIPVPGQQRHEYGNRMDLSGDRHFPQVGIFLALGLRYIRDSMQDALYAAEISSTSCPKRLAKHPRYQDRGGLEAFGTSPIHQHGHRLTCLLNLLASTAPTPSPYPSRYQRQHHCC